jgi:hypothetical protein
VVGLLHVQKKCIARKAKYGVEVYKRQCYLLDA